MRLHAIEYRLLTQTTENGNVVFTALITPYSQYYHILTNVYILGVFFVRVFKDMNLCVNTETVLNHMKLKHTFTRVFRACVLMYCKSVYY